MEKFQLLSREEMEDLSLWEILQYYKKCIISNETTDMQLENHIWEIELAIRDDWNSSF